MKWAAKQFGGMIDPIRVVAPSRASSRGGGGVALSMLEVWRRWMSRWSRTRTGRAGDNGRQLAVVESLFVGPRQRVHLVRCGREHFLVATSADAVSSLISVGADALRKEDPQVVGLPTYGDEKWN
jgi:hypothetical protein